MATKRVKGFGSGEKETVAVAVSDEAVSKVNFRTVFILRRSKMRCKKDS